MSTAGFRALLQHITNEAAEKYARDARFRLGSVFDSYEGLAEHIIAKAGHARKSKRFLGRSVQELEEALKNWDQAQSLLSRVSKYAKPDTRIPIMRDAMKAESVLTKALLRNGVQRRRSAQLLQRIKNVTQVGDDFRAGMRGVGGRAQLRAVPGQETKVLQHGGTFLPHEAARGTSIGYGEIKFSPTRSSADDLALLAHEYGHAVKEATRGGRPSEVAARRLPTQVDKSGGPLYPLVYSRTRRRARRRPPSAVYSVQNKLLPKALRHAAELAPWLRSLHSREGALSLKPTGDYAKPQ